MSRKEFATLRLDQAGAIATITLNRPAALNALNAAMFDDLETVFSEVERDSVVRVILLTGSGDRAFAAGADIRELMQTDSATGEDISKRGQQVFMQIECCSKPVIACINGVALGGGCELALACTMRIASNRAQLGMPELRLGLIPGYGGTQRLPRLIGRGGALHLLLTARRIEAAEALRLGLLQEVVPNEELIDRAQVLAQTICSMAPLAVAGLLEAVQPSADYPTETAIFARLCGTADKREGLASFLEKRSPTWHGR